MFGLPDEILLSVQFNHDANAVNQHHEFPQNTISALNIAGIMSDYIAYDLLYVYNVGLSDCTDVGETVFGAIFIFTTNQKNRKIV